MMVTFRLGDSSDDVKQIQIALIALGFKLDADGVFGPQTEKVVKAFQKARGLAVDGVAGAATLGALGLVDVAPVPATPAGDGAFDVDGWYAGARRFEAHAGRVGGTIDACSIVAHTTDCFPGTMPVVLKSWREQAGNGACAHFYVGKRAPTAEELLGEHYPSCGVVQMVSIRRNGNHAGGARMEDGHYVQWHGNYRVDGQVTHPNLLSIGIEVDNAGRLNKSHGVWIHSDSQKPLPNDQVFVDSEGRGWERATDYQLEELTKLVKALDAHLRAMPAGMTVIPNGEHKSNGVAWAATKQARIVAHATLDPNNKTDCGPQILDHLRQQLEVL